MVNRKIDYKYLSSDIVFKYIFGTDENKKYTAKFLELFMNISPDLLDDIVIENSVKLTPKTVTKRKYELDVIVVIPKLNMKVILEMQNELNNNTLSKNIIYLFSLIGKELKSGQKDFSKCSRFIEINLVKHFCGYLKEYEDEYYITGNKHKKILKREYCNIKIVDISKYNIGSMKGRKEELKIWLALINASTKEEIKEICDETEEYPMIKEVIEKMNEFQGKKYVQELWLNEVLHRSELQSSYDEGRSFGFNEGKIEIALKMLENNKSLDEIKLYTNISIEEINKLKNKIKKSLYK